MVSERYPTTTSKTWMKLSTHSNWLFETEIDILFALAIYRWGQAVLRRRRALSHLNEVAFRKVAMFRRLD